MTAESDEPTPPSATIPELLAGQKAGGSFVTRLSHVRPVSQNDQRRRASTNL
jgi:hypothetical protein